MYEGDHCGLDQPVVTLGKVSHTHIGRISCPRGLGDTGIAGRMLNRREPAPSYHDRLGNVSEETCLGNVYPDTWLGNVPRNEQATCEIPAGAGRAMTTSSEFEKHEKKAKLVRYDEGLGVVSRNSSRSNLQHAVDRPEPPKSGSAPRIESADNHDNYDDNVRVGNDVGSCFRR